MFTLSRSAAVIMLALVVAALPAPRAEGPKQLIAHRGASAYAPEHTVASYTLAMQQKADFVEPDLAVTKDNVLICLHDDTLDRTTNVAEVFGGRRGGNALANDFTIDEIKRLDAGKWFKPEFTGARVPTFQEMIDLVRGKAGLYPELKSPELYKSRNVDQVKLFVDLVRKNGLEKPESLRTTPVIIQSFDETAIPRVLLTSNDADVATARLREVATFATGIAPEKAILARHPGMVAAAHNLRLTVTSWTFRADDKTSFPTVRDEMAHYLYTLGIDALFTNNPDQFPRR